MKINLIAEHLNGLKVIQPDVFDDDRGFFMEVFRTDEFEKLGIPTNFVQDNHSRSGKNVLRGVHFQWEPPMGKIMRVTYGEAFLVAVDIRKGSPSLGQWHGEIVSSQNKKQVWAPAGFARGFCVLSEAAEIQYKCTGLYNKNAESGIQWNDPAIGIKWPISNPQLSEKDKTAQTLEQWLSSNLSGNFRY
ncbi:MAG: dTDP-4-dehydrorhamnose 3,5-epimerase [Bacteroidota bacterium]|nr:dTDP-4-dehydrorhamnose 3,5-epimerase [Bacteroidota bacterium]